MGLLIYLYFKVKQMSLLSQCFCDLPAVLMIVSNHWQHQVVNTVRTYQVSAQWLSHFNIKMYETLIKYVTVVWTCN